MTIELPEVRNSSRDSTKSQGKLTNYLSYYASHLSSNALMLSFYTVQTFTSSPECLVPSGTNMTKWFEAAFKGGWILTLISFLFFTFIDPINRKTRLKYVPGRRVYKSDGVTMLLSFVFEVLIRMALYFASILQFVLLMTGASRYCTDVMNVLKPEGHWLFILASAQVISNTVFAVWKIFLLQAEKEDAERRIDYGTPLQTSYMSSS